MRWAGGNRRSAFKRMCLKPRYYLIRSAAAVTQEHVIGEDGAKSSEEQRQPSLPFTFYVSQALNPPHKPPSALRRCLLGNRVDSLKGCESTDISIKNQLSPVFLSPISFL